MLCWAGFVAEGEVRLAGARIGGRLDFTGAKLTPDRPEKDGWILDLGELKTGTLFLRGLAKPPEGVDLTQAQVDTFIDDAASWPHLVVLRGFTYGVLHEQPRATARMRLTWLRRDPEGYTPQPYEQLASVYRRAGRERDARTVEFANQRARRHELSLASRLSSLDALVGYGYRPWQPLVWLLGWWIAGALVFTLAYPHHMTLAKPGQPHHTFQPAVYALDVLLPVIDFEQQGSWIPEGAVRWWAWASIVAGWVLVTAFIAALTGALRRE
jgi:hypothetical protein